MGLQILVGTYFDMVRMSSNSTMSTNFNNWFKDQFPCNAGENQDMAPVLENVMELLLAVAVKAKPFLMMSNWGAAFRIFGLAFFAYFDIISDVLVSMKLREKGLVGAANITLGCILLAMTVQSIVVYIDVHKSSDLRNKAITVALTFTGVRGCGWGPTRRMIMFLSPPSCSPS